MPTENDRPKLHQGQTWRQNRFSVKPSSKNVAPEATIASASHSHRRRITISPRFCTPPLESRKYRTKIIVIEIVRIGNRFLFSLLEKYSLIQKPHHFTIKSLFLLL